MFDTPLLKRRFYPVDIERRLVVNDPYERERDLARRYSTKVIGLRGERINSIPFYRRECVLLATRDDYLGAVNTGSLPTG